MLAFVIALIPSVGVLFLFWLVIRAMVQADRREREAQARFGSANRDAPPEQPRTAPNG